MIMVDAGTAMVMSFVIIGVFLVSSASLVAAAICICFNRAWVNAVGEFISWISIFASFVLLTVLFLLMVPYGAGMTMLQQPTWWIVVSLNICGWLSLVGNVKRIRHQKTIWVAA